MADLLVGSIAVEKGIEYAGIFPNADAIRVFDKTKISVNRTPYLGTVNNELIKIHPRYTYDFENDAIIGLYSTVNDKLEKVKEKQCTTRHVLASGVESGDICSRLILSEILQNKAKIDISAFIENTSNKNIDLEVYIYVGGVSKGGATIKILKKSKKFIGLSIGNSTYVIPQTTPITFRIKANKDGCTVEGGVNPSIVRITETI